VGAGGRAGQGQGQLCRHLETAAGGGREVAPAEHPRAATPIPPLAAGPVPADGRPRGRGRGPAGRAARRGRAPRASSGRAAAAAAATAADAAKQAAASCGVTPSGAPGVLHVSTTFFHFDAARHKLHCMGAPQPTKPLQAMHGMVSSTRVVCVGELRRPSLQARLEAHQMPGRQLHRAMHAPALTRLVPWGAHQAPSPARFQWRLLYVPPSCPRGAPAWACKLAGWPRVASAPEWGPPQWHEQCTQRAATHNRVPPALA